MRVRTSSLILRIRTNIKIEERLEDKVPLSLATSVEAGGSALIEMAPGMRDEIDHFAGGCAMLINALDAISTVHPFINGQSASLIGCFCAI